MPKSLVLSITPLKNPGAWAYIGVTVYKDKHIDKHNLSLKFEKYISISEPQIGLSLYAYTVGYSASIF